MDSQRYCCGEHLHGTRIGAGQNHPIKRFSESPVFLSPKMPDSYTGSARLTTAGYRAYACAYTSHKTLKIMVKKQFYTGVGGPNNNNNNNPYLYTYIYKY
jgi:hypothetical protein